MLQPPLHYCPPFHLHSDGHIFNERVERDGVHVEDCAALSLLLLPTAVLEGARCWVPLYCCYNRAAALHKFIYSRTQYTTGYRMQHNDAVHEWCCCMRAVV